MTESTPTAPKAPRDSDGQDSAPTLGRRPRFLSSPSLRFQDKYVWLTFLACMDVMLTWFILERHGGEEMNPVAKLVIDAWGLWGAIGFKFSLLLFVIIACEWISRDKPPVGKFLIWFALIVSSMPVLYSGALLLYHWMSPIAA